MVNGKPFVLLAYDSAIIIFATTGTTILKYDIEISNNPNN